jgi:glycine cleavage system H protein
MTSGTHFNIPEDLYYWVEKHSWARPEPDGTVVIGITDVAQHLAKSIITATPKEAGKAVKKGKSAGTVESGKWVGPVTAPVNGTILEVNTQLKASPGLLNTDPYGAGWFIKIKPDNWEADSRDLVTGPAGIAAYQKFLDEQGIRPGA